MQKLQGFQHEKRTSLDGSGQLARQAVADAAVWVLRGNRPRPKVRDIEHKKEMRAAMSTETIIREIDTGWLTEGVPV